MGLDAYDLDTIISVHPPLIDLPDVLVWSFNTLMYLLSVMRSFVVRRRFLSFIHVSLTHKMSDSESSKTI